jgi:spore coat polysaccharide biosynthesis predicted glycosyltransferase SpsG
LGHLLRVRTLARAAAPGHQIEVLALVEPGLESLLAGLPCPVRFLPTDQSTAAEVERFRPQVLLFDLTRFDAGLLARLRRGVVLTASLSPVFDQMAGVDALFTRVARTPPVPGVQVFAGPHFAIFGEQCRRIDDARYARAVQAEEFPVAVCMGGADASNNTLAVVRSLVELDCALTIWVLLGEGYSHSYDDLVGAVRHAARHEVILAKTSRSMWHVLCNAALAVLAGGLTTIEAVFAGLPSVNLCHRPQQLEMLAELVEAGVCVNAGLFSPAALAEVQQFVIRCSQERQLLQGMRAATTGAVDDQGSQRVLAELEMLLAARARRRAG